MAKNKVSDWDVVANNNTDLTGTITLGEGMPPSYVNDAIREMMAQIKQWQSGTSGDGWTSNGTIESNGTLNITGSLKLDGSTGSSGQVLKSVGSTATPVWTTLGTMSTQNSNAVNITGGSVNVSGSFKLDNSTGTAGQVMVSKGSSDTPVWGNAFIRGMIMLWTGTTAPSGWRICDGGGGTPNLKDKFVMGAGGSKPASGGYFDTPLPVHSHTGTTNNGGNDSITVPLSVSGNTSTIGAKTLSTTTTISGSTKSAGDHIHNGIRFPWNEDDNPDGQTDSVITNNRPGTVATIKNSSTVSGGAHTHALNATGTVTVSPVPAHNHSVSSSGTATVTVKNHTHPFTTANAGATSVDGNLPPYYALAYIMKL